MRDESKNFYVALKRAGNGRREWQVLAPVRIASSLDHCSSCPGLQGCARYFSASAYRTLHLWQRIGPLTTTLGATTRGVLGRVEGITNYALNQRFCPPS